MKTRKPKMSPWLVAAILAVAGVLTAAILAGVGGGAIVVLVFAGLLYAMIWEGGSRAINALQKRWQRKREG